MLLFSQTSVGPPQSIWPDAGRAGKAIPMAECEPFERAVLAFEQAWQQGSPPSIADFLPPHKGGRGLLRRQLLTELVCIDLEFRWRLPSGRKAEAGRWSLEDYAAQFDELGPVNELPLELIGEEYRAQLRWAGSVARTEFMQRFGDRGESLCEMLDEIEHEQVDESEDGGRPLADPMSMCGRRPAFDPRAPLPYSDYVLQRLIGAGRMGKVYRAWQRSLDRTVAVKYLRKAFHRLPEAVERFIEESRMVARLQHSGIAGIHGLGRTRGGGYFIVMEWIDGPDLARVVRGRGPIPAAEAVPWIVQACRAIEHAHGNGIVHCDLKPGNLVRDRNGRVVVTDFGLARSIVADARLDDRMEGTAPFMAPEQIAESWGSIGPRTDVYGLGATLYALLTGRPPWAASSVAEILAQVVSARPILDPTEFHVAVPRDVSGICRRCLARRPEERYATVGELAKALTEVETAA
jgi:tRNA A-37 threonylcarbamoyl transferase component Bud32